jgi:hypothetical protein
VVGGGTFNTIQAGAFQATISGGASNSVWENYATIGGGSSNTIQLGAFWGTLSGGQQNTIQTDAAWATIGGGLRNVIMSNAVSATIAGGFGNRIDTNSAYGVIAGGENNRLFFDTVNAAIGGGRDNVISNHLGATIGGGAENTILGGIGWSYATIPGGYRNRVRSSNSFAAGTGAVANHHGTFIWSDFGFPIYEFSSTAENQFIVRARGGVRFVTGINGAGGPTAGVSLNPDGSSWNSISDRNAKKNFRPVDSRQILEGLAQVPIQRWNYKWDPDNAPPHLGPTAQDFKAAFYAGRDDKHITTLEFDGVALAAIQGLNQKLEDELKAKDAKISALERRLAALEQLLLSITLAQTDKFP